MRLVHQNVERPVIKTVTTLYVRFKVKYYVFELENVNGEGY